MRDHDEERRCSAQRVDVGGVNHEKDCSNSNKIDKISIFVMITEEMVKDFCKCSRKAYTMSGKDCDTCSWGDLTIGNLGMCECVRWILYDL